MEPRKGLAWLQPGGSLNPSPTGGSQTPRLASKPAGTMADRRPLPQLLTRTTCPHCWHKFEPHEVLWISAHPSLRGDPRLGPDVSRRFLPARFTARGAARDELGAECNQLACPNCHLTFPRLCLELKPWFVSIFGAPSCGKSYYLPAMTWRL